ncbi:TetR/AcrR family transcriptional regulator [Legionella spiritensis]|uniref:Putative transcriptional regulator, TetR family n=1 Tax=Legionella spiritensis TaxID=452 RepID=A0A0W0Z639_LEGSP|nr:TetR/AcrR family transcriptional regulator [Legionella spiritensis]KTD64291.1 putative transcriptional regulator, TetR family [Legionella spiritensis]SNV46862.1 putative transcriptional regulator, TetR family [Legionella spiritensis]VEG91143.1 putative transcriptional regulator, TetR family [Legionella spiritensis]
MTYKRDVQNQDAVNRCMLLFWEQGYFKTSIDDLVKASGLSRAAIYNQFGNKDAFFTAMLEQYEKEVTSQLTAPLQQKPGGIKAIHAFFDQFVVLSENGWLKNGCFYINAATDTPLYSPDIVEKIHTFIRSLTNLFRNALEIAQSAGDISQDLDIEDGCQFLVANLFGLLSLARATNDSNTLKAQVRLIKQFF